MIIRIFFLLLFSYTTSIAAQSYIKENELDKQDFLLVSHDWVNQPLINECFEQNKFQTKFNGTKKDFDSTMYYYNQGTVLSSLNKFEEAIEAFDCSLKYFPDFVWAHDNKGIALLRLGMFQEAIRAFDIAIKINPNFVKAYRNKAITMNKLGMYKDALTVSNTVITHIPDFIGIYFVKSDSLYGLARYKEAIQILDYIIEHIPNSATLYYNKGMALSALGKYEEAITAYNIAIKYKSDFVWAIDNKEELVTKLKRQKLNN